MKTKEPAPQRVYSLPYPSTEISNMTIWSSLLSIKRKHKHTHTTFKGSPSPLRYNQIAWRDIKTSMICLLLKIWHPAWSCHLPKHQQCHSHWRFPSTSSPPGLCIPCLFYLEHLFLQLSLAKSHLSRCTSHFIFHRKLFLNTPHSKLTILYFMSPLNSNYILLSLPITLCCNY